MNHDDDEKDEDIRPIGAVICAGAGVLLLVEGVDLGGWWRLLLGFMFVCFGIYRLYQLVGEGKS